MHFMQAITSYFHILLEFLLGTQIKPGSPSGAVCTLYIAVLSSTHLRHEQPSLAMLSTGTTVHSMSTRRTCFRESVRLFWYSPAAASILSHVMTSSVVRPMQCLKLGLDAIQPWKVLWQRLSHDCSIGRRRWFVQYTPNLVNCGSPLPSQLCNRKCRFEVLYIELY